MTVLFVSCCIVGALTFIPPVAGQQPVPEKKDANAKAAAGQRGESDKDKLQGNWQILSLDGDIFKMCMNGDGTSVCRPEEFVTKKGSPVMITTLKKLAAKK